jgi:E3 ubiquitin-protein ligase makorin
MRPKNFDNGMGGYLPGIKQGPPAGQRKIGKNGKIEYEGDEECVICLDWILANNKRFGILENCCHAFCLDCIRNWRATFDKKVKKTHFRTCPICRENSYLVIPSTRMLYNGDLKD